MTFADGARQERSRNEALKLEKVNGTGRLRAKAGNVRRSLRAAIPLQDLWNQVQLPDLVKTDRFT